MVGGGATGVELAGTLAELRRTVLTSTFPDVDPARVHVRLVEMAPYLLGPFDEKLREYAKAQLLARDVDVRLDTRIGEVTAGQVKLVHGEDLPSDITVWADERQQQARGWPPGACRRARAAASWSGPTSEYRARTGFSPWGTSR